MLSQLWQKHRGLVGQAGRFGLVGLLNAVVDFGVYISLTRNFDWWMTHFLVANLLSGWLANVNSFLWNRHWTFVPNGQGVVRQYLHFVGVSAAYLGFVQLGLWLLAAEWGVYDLLAKAVLVAVAAGLYFSVLRGWVFRSPTPPPEGLS